MLLSCSFIYHHFIEFFLCAQYWIGHLEATALNVLLAQKGDEPTGVVQGDLALSRIGMLEKLSDSIP